MKAGTAVIALLLAAATPLIGEESDSIEPGAGDAVEKGAVTLGVEAAPEGSGKQVSVSVRDEAGGEAAAGMAEVDGFPFIRGGEWADTEWKVSGSEITGTLRNRQGKVEGTFTGTITADGIRGTFTHAGGRVGAWTWNGAPPGSE
jgi:hypothetical protein